MSFDLFEWLSNETDPRTLAIAAVALLVIGSAAGVLYGIKPAWAIHQELAEEHFRANAERAGNPLVATDAIETIEQDIVTLRDQLYGNAAGIPDSEIESFVVDSLDQISSRHGVSLLAITPGVTGSIWMFDELPYEVRVEGTFFSVHEWLHDVEEALRPMVVKRFAISPNRSETGVVLDLRVVAYRAVELGDA